MTRRELDADILSFEGQNKILAENVFGPDFLKESVLLTRKHSTSSNVIEHVDNWIQTNLDRQDSLHEVNVSEADPRPGRLGPNKVMFDYSTRSEGGSFSICDDRLRLTSQANFSTIKANVCVYSGKWHYELQLDTKGVMQVGWDMGQISKFSPEIGVGDTIGSYGYDGNRVRKWNVATFDYGEPWLNGDIIGCAIDLDVGTVSFYRNGISLGEAFRNIQLGPGCAYFPAVSLAFNESILANFGGTPFKYPIEGYEPPQMPPTSAIIRASLIFTWFHKLLDVSEAKHYNLGKVDKKEMDKELEEETSILVFARLLMRQLSPLLNSSYIIEACLIPFLSMLANISYIVEKKGSPISDFKFKAFCEILTIFLQEEELVFVMKTITRDLISRYRQVSNNVEYITQKRNLMLLKSLSNNSTIKDWLMRNFYFAIVRLPEFMDTKPIDEPALIRTVSVSWWENTERSKGSDKGDEQKKQNYLSSCKKIHLGVKDLELLQIEILEKLLENKEGSSVKPSSRKNFLYMFRYFIRDNMLTSRVSLFMIMPRPVRTPLPIALGYFHRLLSVLRRLWEKELPHESPHVPVSKFFNCSIEYFAIDRFGGAYTYLIKKYKESLIKNLGEDHRLFKSTEQATQNDPGVVRPLTPPANIIAASGNPLVTAFRLVGLNITARLATPEPIESDYKAAPPGAVRNYDSLIELMDGLIMFYHTSAHKQLQNISGVKENMDRYIKAFNETQIKLKEAAANHPASVSGLKYSLEVFQNKIEELSRYMAWIRAAVYTPAKKSDLFWLLQAVLLTLRHASTQAELFSFVPDFYIDTLVDISTALRSYFDESSSSADEKGYRNTLTEVAEFLALHFSDTRIVNPSCKDTLIQALAGFVTSSGTLKCLENISQESQVQMVKDLLQPYNNRPWGQSNWILLRIWQGCGFAFRYQKSPHLTNQLGPKLLNEHSLLIHQNFKPCPSQNFQNLLAKVMLSNEEMASAFVNSVLNQLNWSFSEVIGMLQEIQDLSIRPERVFIEAHQLKVCATCFDFTLGLLRVLEMIVNVSKPVFIDFKRLNAENFLERLCQLLGQILMRVTSVSGCFYHVVSLDIPDLETIDPFPILAAVVGILVALMQDDKSLNAENKQEMSPVVRYLLTEPAFQIKSLKFVLGEDEEANNNSEEKRKLFSFSLYPEAVSEAEINKVRNIISILTKCMPKITGDKETPDEDLCLICCAFPMSVIFIPCLHKSCKSCISHFLLMNTVKKCFFCKSSITSVTDFSGNVIHNLTKDNEEATTQESNS